jgi:GLPGLI family protein
MKKIIILLVFTIVFCGFAQKKATINADLWVSYQLNYKKLLTSESTQSVNTTLIVTSQGSLFTFEAMMNFDKIQQERELTEADVLLNRSPYYFLIKGNGDSIEHYETIGSDSYKFKENLNHDWKLIDQDTIISGYACKKAIVKYAGRDWSAWYSPEIPITVGPYKFHGLPGLVMMLGDSDNVFSFVVKEVKKGDFPFDSKTENFFVKDGGKPFESIDMDEFYKIRKKFSEMTLNEQIKYSNRDEIAVPTLIVEGVNGEKVRLNNNKSKNKNFIERFE